MTAIETPTYQELLADFLNAKRRSYILMTIESSLALYLITKISWTEAIYRWPYTLLVLLVVLGEAILGMLKLYFTNKVSVEKLKDSTRFGAYSKQDIIQIVNDVKLKMKLGALPVNVFITRDKDLNAFALRFGLGPVWGNLNTIYLNRALFHVLDREELVGVIAHELGHISQFSLPWHQYYLFRLFVMSIVTIVVVQIVGYDNTFTLLAPAAAVLLFLKIGSIFQGRQSHMLEYLCDSCGAEISGLENAIRSELKLGLRSELHLKILQHALKQNLEGQAVSHKNLIKHYENALPFGELDAEAVKQELSTLLKTTKKNATEGLSIKGFLSYMGFFESLEAKEELEKQAKDLEKLFKIPRLSGFNPETKIPETRAEIEELIKNIEANPTAPLFHVTNETKDDDSTHPSPRKRILFLWRAYA
jgi:Zn-dependent protease with chaperone function